MCGSNYILTGKYSYQCSGNHGGACTNSVRVGRKHAEKIILDPIRDELLSPERVQQMAKKMQELFADRAREKAERADAVPEELKAISDRIGRLRDRLSQGDPDLEPDEIQVAIDLAEEKRKDLIRAQPASKESAKLISLLPKAAEAYRRQIAQGLDDDPRAAGKARVILRKLLGSIELSPGPDMRLWAEYELRPSALLKTAGTGGSGGAFTRKRAFICRAVPVSRLASSTPTSSSPASRAN